MNLYVWDNFATAWSNPGLAIAIAESQSDAKDAIERATGNLYRPVGDAAVYDLTRSVVYFRTGCD